MKLTLERTSLDVEVVWTEGLELILELLSLSVLLVLLLLHHLLLFLLLLLEDSGLIQQWMVGTLLELVIPHQ